MALAGRVSARVARISSFFFSNFRGSVRWTLSYKLVRIYFNSMKADLVNRVHDGLEGTEEEMNFLLNPFRSTHDRLVTKSILSEVNHL